VTLLLCGPLKNGLNSDKGKLERKWLFIYEESKGKKLYRKGTKGINEFFELKVFEPLGH
jgi:hypothetical protein